MLNFGGWLGGESHGAGHKARALVQEGALLLDVRTREEFASGHLKNALNIPVQELPGRTSELPPRERRIVVYCKSGGRSAAAAAHLRRLGYEVHDLGPMSAW